MLLPGQSEPAEGGGSSGGGSSSKKGSSSNLSGGAIAGIVVGVVAGCVILGALFFILGRNRVYREWISSRDGSNSRASNWVMSHSAAPSGDYRDSQTPSYLSSPRAPWRGTNAGLDGIGFYPIQQAHPEMEMSPTPPATGNLVELVEPPRAPVELGAGLQKEPAMHRSELDWRKLKVNFDNWCPESGTAKGARSVYVL